MMENLENKTASAHPSAPSASTDVAESAPKFIQQLRFFFESLAQVTKTGVQERTQEVVSSFALMLASLLLGTIAIFWCTVAFVAYWVADSEPYLSARGVTLGMGAGLLILSVAIGFFAQRKLSKKKEPQNTQAPQLDQAGKDLLSASKDFSLAREWLKGEATTIVVASLAVGTLLGLLRSEPHLE